MVPAVDPRFEVKPSTARYCAVEAEHKHLLRAHGAPDRDPSRFADGAWLVTLATLEFELAFNAAHDDLAIRWAKSAYNRGVHQHVSLDLRTRVAARLEEDERRAAYLSAQVAS